MNKSEKVGRILWWSERNENGIIVDSSGNEYYFDRSVLKSVSLKQLKSDTYVLFNVGIVEEIFTAREVSAPKGAVLKKCKHRFEMDKTQLSLPFELGNSFQAS